jgi:3-hydroxyisobutyrate dehydrogenase-like beta-hydroxyacid dehydrogenase
MATTVGLLHPGEMGASVGASAREAGADVVWASEGRSAHTRTRAEAAGLRDVGALDALVSASDVVLSVCPPAKAPQVAAAVARRAFAGIFVDANAVNPGTAREIGNVVEAGGARFVDGGIIGPPAPGPTRLYLSGEEAPRVAALFAAGPVEAIALRGEAGAASVLKMAFAAWTKGSAALLLAIRALARAEGVEDALLAQWEKTNPQLAVLSEGAALRTAPKAWRFVGEMDEIASTFAAADLPEGFHRAAAEVYARLSDLKDAAPDAVTLDAVLERLRR